MTFSGVAVTVTGANNPRTTLRIWAATFIPCVLVHPW
jgi:hypothetical protein